MTNLPTSKTFSPTFNKNALIVDTYARRILCAATIWVGCFAHREQNNQGCDFS